MRKDQYIRSIDELASFLGCSRPIASRIKKEHSEVVSQSSRTFVIIKPELLASMKKKYQKSK